MQYNIMFEYIFDKCINAQQLARACNTVMAHYTAFSCCITLENGSPELALLDKAPTTDYIKVTENEYAQIKAQYMRPFVLDRQHLCRATVVETEKAIYLLNDVHHIITDGVSKNLFETALELAYNGQEIPTEDYTIFDANADERKHAESAEIKASYDYYDKLLSGVETDSNILPDRTETDRNHAKTLYYDLDVSTNEIKTLAQANGVTENVILLSAFAYALAKYTGQSESLFTSINNGRRGKPLDNTMGFFVRTFPLYFQIDENSSVSDYIASVKKNYFDTMCHSDVSFSQLAQQYGVRSDIKYVYQGNLINDFTFNGKTVKKTWQECNDAMSNLDVMITIKDEKYNLRLDYRDGLYSEENILGFTKMFSCIAKGMTSQKYLKDIELVSDEDKKALSSFNATETPYDHNQTVWEILKERIAKSSDSIAVSHNNNVISYADFDRLTAKIANYLTKNGIGREDFVAILIPRNEFMAITAWGVVRSGAAYQPLDPTYPQERLNFMVKDSGAKLLIADRNLRPLLNEYEGQVLYTDEICNLPEAIDFQPKDTPESALVIIYTSGTTGTPKGCILENRNIVCFHHNHAKIMELDNHSRVATYASFGFDAGIMDIFTTLMAGGSLYVIPDEIRLDIPRINDFYKENQITHGFITTQVGRMFAEITDCKSLKALLVGGEKLVPFNPPTDFRFINGYGPSETIAYVCHHQVTDASPIQPIGKPSGNIKLYVTDKYGRMLPAGACGELCISGGQVGRGYLNRPEKTAEAFTSNPFCTEKGYERIYKTGDVVRLLHSGEIDFVGRRDGQVKIRGFRVELTEIEEVIRRFDGITDATVVAYDEQGGGKFITAYIVSNQKIDIKNLNDFILSEKPAYMVPAVTMQIDAIPYNQNQKVNKRALPKPEREIDVQSLEMPENESQQRIYDIAKQILGHEAFGISTNLFEAGMTSIGTLKFNVELGKAFNKAIKISDIKDHNTIKSLEEFLSGENTVQNYTIQADYPLMQNQMGILVETLMNANSLEYNIPALFKLSPEIDVQKLQNAICKAINAHPYIKTILKSDENGAYRAIRNDNAEPAVEIIDIQTLPVTSELIKPFEMNESPLYRIKIFNSDSDKYLFLDIHHIISDGTSIGILLNDINLAYQNTELETETFSGFESTLEEENLRSSEKYANAQTYFGNLLNGCNTECLPNKCAEPDAKDGDNATHHFSFDASSLTINDFCKKHNLSLNAFFNAVFGHVLATFLHADDVTYCTVYNGRNDSRLANTFAMLVKTLPVHCSPNANISVLDFVKVTQNQLIESMSNDIFSFAEISKQFGVKPDIFFNYQGDNFDFDTIGGEKAEMLKLEYSVAKAPLAIEISLKNGIFSADTTYRTDYFCKEFISSLIDSLATACNNFTSTEFLRDVSMLSESEKQHFAEMNATEKPFEKVPAHTFFERQAFNKPEHIAVKTSKSSLTYAELNERSNRVANALVKLGIKQNNIIGLIMDRNELVPVAEIGIMKAGGAFLPMLPTYPDDRLDFCITDADCRYVIATQDIIDSRKDLFSASKNYRALALETLLTESETSAPKVDFSLNQLAYCIYTSGSTGTPKGVMIEQHNLTNFIQTASINEAEEKGNTILCMASISFDMSITEMFASLCHGNTLYIATEDEIHNLDMMQSAFIQNKVDIMMMTPSFAWSLLSLPNFGNALSQLQAVILGAEAFQPALFDKLKALNPDMLIQNGYGPTECTQVCSVKTITNPKSITIGCPFANTKFYVMDANGNPLPRYAVGELIICGEGVCRGYVKLPEKNAASFIEINGQRGYRSGDLVRINRDNEVEFGGRADNQVKLRGFRVELDEIETVMQDFEGISQSKVIVRNNGTEDFLAGFFTADTTIDIEELTTFLKKKLTYYMVPSAIMQLDKMPMTANGKLDKKALPEIRPAKRTKAKRTPKKSLEERILDLFRSVLKVDECYVDDNFFEIGGTSLSASNVVMQLKSDGYKIEYQDIFDHQSAEELAEYLESLQPAVTQDQKHTKDELFHMDENIAELLKFNTMEYASEVERKPLGDVVLTGATGFLGNHVLKELIDNEYGKIYCLMRKGDFNDLETRLKSMLYYYFEDYCEEAFANRIIMIEGDITEEHLNDKFEGITFDTLINCAACVKHFANDNSIEFVNVHGVENLIALCKKKDAKMIQISTTSVPGVHNEETYRINLRMTEDKLFVIDDMNNQYSRSKYQAELLMLDAIKDGMRGKIIRVGNLMGRYSDGEFQTNMRTNAFLNGLRGFVAIGKCPISHSTDPMSFSPIDCTAKAVVLLAGTNDKFTAFNADSRSTFDEAKVMEALNHCGIPVKAVPDEEYYADFYRIMSDPAQNKKVSALLTNDRPDVHVVNTDNRFTANILYRLGFSWPFVDDIYLQKVIEALDSLGFFWME